ncbi:hypothetical protein [Arthrobacter sp. A2-55]|uniref:hypothetical protein n=1 Tax=Arthrobacter sp. A2-55 TaxID=2897337 RepID=UPI0021CD6C12|nr:hypothetical protein [Arthrobacter sp. A2-55]MCU6480374.1 hypothetical protein [Arthrobacter sp. A2-55]
MEGRNWLVRRAEARLATEMGGLVYIASSRRIRWTWLLPCMVLGFVYGVIGQFVISPRSSATTPDRFGNIPLFLVTSVLTGLVLWALTFAIAFRKLLVFDGGMVTTYAQQSTTRVFPWADVNPASVMAVTAGPAGPTSLLAAKRLTKLGVRGKYAVVFEGLPRPNKASAAGQTSAPGFWTFETSQDPAPLVRVIEQAMMKSGVPGAARICARALPPHVLTERTSLD